MFHPFLGYQPADSQIIAASQKKKKKDKGEVTCMRREKGTGHSPEHQLRLGNSILLRQSTEHFTPESLSCRKGRIGLHYDAVFLAASADFRLGVERVDLDLVDDGFDAGIGRHELLDVGHAEITHPNGLDLFLVVVVVIRKDVFLEGPPRGQSCVASAQGRVQQEEIDISEASALGRRREGLVDRGADPGRRGRVVAEFRGEEEIRSLEDRTRVLLGLQKGRDGARRLEFVVVPLRRVEPAVSELEGRDHRAGCLVGGQPV